MIYMKVLGEMVKQMDKVSIEQQMVQFTKGIGFAIESKEMV